MKSIFNVSVLLAIQKSIHRIKKTSQREQTRLCWNLSRRNIRKQDKKSPATSWEKVDQPRVVHNSCIGHDLIICLEHKDRALMDYLGVIIVPVQRDVLGNMVVAYPELATTPLKWWQEGAIMLDAGTADIHRKKKKSPRGRQNTGRGFVPLRIG